MKLAPTPDGKLKIQPETEFDLIFLENIGCVVSANFHIENDIEKCSLTIKKRIPDDE
jgi:hypothetical protein